MNRISDRIYLGDSYDARTRDILDESKITAILNVAGDLLQDSLGRTYVHAPLIDGPGNENHHMASAISELARLYKEGHTILIHCHMGVSRSPTVLAAFIAINDQIDFGTALDYIKKVRPIVHPHISLMKMAKEIINDHTGGSTSQESRDS